MTHLLWYLTAYFIVCAIEISSGNHNASEQGSEWWRKLTDACNDPVWCDIKMPTKSYFRFEPPTDGNRWRTAQIRAASGEQVLLKKVRTVFTHSMDFLDGDVLFRHFNNIADFHVDHNKDLSRLTSSYKAGPVKKVKVYSWEKGLVPSSVPKIHPVEYDVAAIHRAPVAMVGYSAFASNTDNSLYTGKHLGDAVIERSHLYQHYKAVEKQIDKPFILLHGANENWGILSTVFPNRTVDWGTMSLQDEKHMLEILDHPKLLLFAVTQHHNMTHPKLVTFPRGMPLNNERKRSVLFDAVHSYATTTRKENLVFTASSSWLHRPYVAQCIADKFEAAGESKEINIRTSAKEKRTRKVNEEYYKNLASARTGMALSGLGADTYRLWETMTMGTVAVLEKSMGLDKAVWRLPALLVEDFDLVTPALLRSAYVEALYRAEAEEFEFERLTQSFWWTFVMNVSTSMSQDAISAKFPPALSEDASFARPKVPYDCGERMEKCGKGTKRTPKTSCAGKPENEKKDRK